jgi:hypothetical protein
MLRASETRMDKKMRQPAVQDPASFCRSLELRAARFADFLRGLRAKKHWASQDAIRNDPLVVAAFQATQGKPRTFPRLLDRAVKEKRVSPLNLRRFAVAFGMRSAAEFVSAFVRWERSAPALLRSGEPRPVLVKDAAGRWVLPRSTVIKGQGGEEYIIRRRLNGEARLRGDSYRAQLKGTARSVFIKTLSLDSSLTPTEVDKRIERFNLFFQREQSSLQKLKHVDGVAKFRDYGYVDLNITTDRVRKVPFLA